MITIIHGEDTIKSREYFLSEKQKKKDAIALEGVSVTATDLLQALQGNDLFNETKYIFAEEFFSKRKPGKETDEIISIIKQNQAANIIFWESKQLTPKQIAIFKNPVIKQFKPSPVLFQFLDMLKPGNGLQEIKKFHEVVEAEEEQFVFFMLIRQVRLLLALLDDGTEFIDEIKRMQPWQKTKLQKQAKQFTSEQLISLYNKLYQLDFEQKTGSLRLPLTHSIDFLLAEL